MIALCALLVMLGGSQNSETDSHRFRLPSGATVIVPAELPDSGSMDLVVHLHGAVEAVERALAVSGWSAVVVVVNEPGLSSAYARPFADPARFPALLDEVRTAMVERLPGVDLDRGRLIVSSFSAGFGGVRELLAQPEVVDQIDALVLADSLYCGYEGSPANRRLDPEKMAGFRRFASEAHAGRKAMLVSHCALVPEDYGSTAETADDLVRHVGGTFESVTEDLGHGWLLSRRFDHGSLRVLGFEGAEGEDHLRHLRRLGELWRIVPLVPPDDVAGRGENR
ncbi:hypothetical protein [Tautonia marina]|uniref:hypothetical protein n=1 Tax=Tautonia marina TaxID=2653855 RepID=UPI0012606F29|nr:hypothetical protein [Tautonia marina]